MEGATAKLRCELSKAAPVEWRKGPKTLRARDRVSLRQEGAVCELEIRELTAEDAGEYSCVCGQERTSATLAVRGKDRVWPRGRCLVAAVASLLSVPFPALFTHCPAPFPFLTILFSLSRSPSVLRHMYRLDLLKSQSQCVLAHPGYLCPAGCCVFCVLSISYFICVYREPKSLCVFLPISSPACQVPEGSQEGGGHGRGHSQAAL